MKTFQIHELVEGKPGITITLIPGFGDGYNEVQQDLIDGHVKDVVDRIREVDPSVTVIISPMNTNTPVGKAEAKTLTLSLTSDVLLHVLPTHVKVGKWRGFHDRVGSYIGN